MREPPFGYPYWKDFALSPAPAGDFLVAVGILNESGA